MTQYTFHADSLIQVLKNVVEGPAEMSVEKFNTIITQINALPMFALHYDTDKMMEVDYVFTEQDLPVAVGDGDKMVGGLRQHRDTLIVKPTHVNVTPDNLGRAFGKGFFFVNDKGPIMQVGESYPAKQSITCHSTIFILGIKPYKNKKRTHAEI